MNRLLELSSKRKKELFVVAGVSVLMLLLQLMPGSRSPMSQGEKLKRNQQISGRSHAYTLTLANNRWFRLPAENSHYKSADLVLMDASRTSEIVAKVYQRDNTSVVSISSTSSDSLAKKFATLTLVKQEQKTDPSTQQLIKFMKYKGQMDFSLRPKNYWVAFVESKDKVIEVIGTSLPGREAEVSSIVHSLKLSATK